jgi:3D (Asp-Asp-Asp) domain-containing protein
VILYRSRPQVREKILVVSDLKKKNSAHSAMSELLSKSNAASTGKNETIKRAVPSGRIYRQPAARSQQMQTPVPASMHPAAKKTNNPRIYQKAGGCQQKSDRIARNASSIFPRGTGRRAVKASFKVARAVVATVVLLCLCTGIISAVLIMNPGQTDEMAIDTAIGARAAVAESAAETEVQTAQAEPVLQKTDESVSQKSADRFTVTFTFYDRESLTCTSNGKTVGALVELLELELTDAQRSNISMEAMIQADTTVSVDAVTYDTVAVNTAIPYETKYVDVQTIPKGSTQTHQKGVNGTQTAEYQVTYVNGIEVERVLANEYTSQNPTDNIVYRGVGGTLQVGGKSYSYSYYIDCRSTVYTGGGITASGLPATEKVIAVDPKVIPLGTTCYISGSYAEVGFRTAADTGGGIKGNFIDIYYESNNPNFAGYGRRNVRVYIF